MEYMIHDCFDDWWLPILKEILTSLSISEIEVYYCCQRQMVEKIIVVDDQETLD